MIVDKINSYLSGKLEINEYIAHNIGQLAQWSFKRQFMEDHESSNTISLSQAGKCTRQLAYKYQNYAKKGKEIDSRAKIIFWQGDLVELMLMKLAKLAGCNIMATGLNQLNVSIPIKKEIPMADDEIVEVKGHPDGILLADTTYLVECKSMSSYSFKRFQGGEIDDSYLTQINMYLWALKLSKCVVVGLNKDSGVLHELVIEWDAKITNKGIDNLTNVLNSNHLPAGWYTFDEKTRHYPWQCLYCQWWGLCKPNAEKVLVRNAYKLKEREDKNGI
jgi:hypothetical protein